MPSWGRGAGAAFLFAVPSEPPQYCAMLAVDIQSFNDQRRSEDVQPFMRAAMYGLLQHAFGRAGLTWSRCHHEDRGDGALIIAPPGYPAAALVDPLIDYLRAALRWYNKFCHESVRIHLRVAAHAGNVYFDEHGVSGHAVTHLFRMLEAPTFKDAHATSGADFALVSSEALYEEVISPGHGLIDPDMYAPILIQCKETRGRAWLYLPPVRHPFLHGVNGQARPGRAGQQRPDEDETRRSAWPRSVAPVTKLPIPFPDVRVRRAQGDEPGDGDAAAARPSIRDSVTAHARLIAASAASAATRSRRLAPVPGTTRQARLRERFQPGHGMQHA